MSARICTVEDCQRAHVGRGYCNMHLKRLAQSGTLEARPYGRQGCSIEGCQRTHVAQGMCELHWRRSHKHGDPHYDAPVGRVPRPSAERFWEKVDTGQHPGDCWEWLAARNQDGYGIFGEANGSVLAHRFAWEQEHGPVPEGLELDHRCFNRGCVRPSHLEPVTHAENVRRMRARLAEVSA